MSEKFTPGPWKVVRREGYDAERGIIGEVVSLLIGNRVIDITCVGIGNISDEYKAQLADVDLLADAWQLPDLRREIKELKAINKEMYEALEAIAVKLDMMRPINPFEYGEIRDEIIRDINALRKARGETE